MTRYDKRDLLSAFQKDIRRCNKHSLYWTKELSLDHNSDNLLWNKMEVIGSEDIGMACPWIQTVINKYRTQYYNSDDVWEKIDNLLSCVNILIHQNKSRLCDNINHAYFKDSQPIIDAHKYISIYARFIDNLNNKNVDNTLKYASHLFKMEKEDKLIDALKRPIDKHSNILIRLFNKYNSEKRNKTDVLFLCHLILYRTMDINIIPMIKNVKDISIEEIKNIYNNKLESKLEFADYVFDKHTDKGKQLGRGFEHFYDVGVKLEQSYIDDKYDIYEEIARKNNCKNFMNCCKYH